MHTPAHLIFAAASFARPETPYRNWAVLGGALAPDLSLYLMAGVSLFILGYSPHHVFDTLYFSDAWQTVFAIDNSFVIWGCLFGLAWWRGWDLMLYFTASGLLHLLFDFPLHHDDGRPHFWPISDWVYQSPVSYWDPRYYGDVVAPIEIGVSLVLCGVLLRRFSAFLPRALICCGAVVQILPVIMWAYVFALNGG